MGERCDKIIGVADKIYVNIINFVLHPIMMPLYFFIALFSYQSIFSVSSIATKALILKDISIITLLIPFIALIVSNISVRLMRESVSREYNFILSHIVLILSYSAAIFIIKNVVSIKLLIAIFCVPIALIVCYWILRLLKTETSLWVMSIAAFMGLSYWFTIIGIGRMQIPILLSIFGCGIVSSARIYLKDDTLKSHLISFVVGFVIPTFIILIVF